MEPAAGVSTNVPNAVSSTTCGIMTPKVDPGGMFRCSFCSLQERFDYKGTKPPFAKHLSYLEECYIMKDPFSLPNRGEVLVLGADCSICRKIICLQCSIFFSKRFCQKCAINNMAQLPTQLQGKVKKIKPND